MYKIGCRIYYDFTIGRKESYSSAVDCILRERLAKTEEIFANSYAAYYEKVKLKADMEKSLCSLNEKRKTVLSQGILDARTPYHLHFDEPHDLFSGGAAGIQAGCQVFLDEIYHRHPAAAMGFTVAAALGGLPAVWAALPNNFPFIKAYMTHFSNFLGEAVVGNTQGIQAGISLALLEGKLAFLTLDFFKRGPESVLFHALQGTLENPTVVGLGLLSTYGIGCLIAHSFYIHVSLPYMTQRAKTSLECPLPIETAVWGAKFATLVYEILFDVGHHASSPAQSKKDLLCSRLEELLMPVIKEKILGLAETVGSDIISGEAKKAAAIYVEALLEFKAGNDESLQKLFSEHRLNLLDETTLSDKEKYQILRWAEAEYGENNPHYVAALQGTLYPQRQSGPLATSIRILFSYPLNFVRMILSGATYLYDRLWQEKAHSEARLSLQGWNEFWLRKVPGDVGLVIRASHKVIKYTFLMAAAFSLSLVMLAANVVCGLGAVVEMLCRLLCCNTYQPAYSFSLFKAIIHTAKMTGNFLTQPKFFTHLFQAVIGWFRQAATHKHLHLVDAGVVIDETYKELLGRLLKEASDPERKDKKKGASASTVVSPSPSPSPSTPPHVAASLLSSTSTSLLSIL